MHILGTILRFLFAWIDGIVAKVLTIVYDLLMQLANLTLYSESIVKVVGQRIGILLGIFMLFRLAVSLINYMISPEKFSDSKQGGAALVKNVIFSLILLATVNTIFETAYSVQKKIVESKIIEKIFFGETSNADMDIGYYLYTGFFTPNLDVASTCAEVWNPSIDLANSECNEELGGLLETNELNTVMEARNNLDMSVVFSNYDLVTANKGGVLKGQWIFEYTPIVSTAAGVVCLLILISFSMELAKRAIKLLFLQIVAPVPIIFNMDTGKGKDVFQKWYKECFNTYISVFIRLLAIDFGVFMIVILKSEFSKIFQDSVGVNIFIIIGCLMFAKEVPKLIENMFGIKMDGMSLRPLKKFEEQALLGKNITGLAAGATAGTIGAFSHAGKLQGFKGAWSGMINGKGFKDSWKNQVGSNKTMRNALAENSTFLGRTSAYLSSTLGLPTESENIEARVHKIDEDIKEIDNVMKPLNDSIKDRTDFTDKSKAMEDRAREKIKSGEGGFISQQYLAMTNYVENLREQLKNGVTGITEQQVAQAEMRANSYLNDVGVYEYIDYTTGLTDEVSNYNSDGHSAGSKTKRTALTGSVAISDGYMNSLNDDLVAMTRNSTEYQYEDATGAIKTVKLDSTAVTNGAASRHGKANEVSGSVNSDKRTKVSVFNSKKQSLEQEKARLYEKQRTAKANQSAIGK